MTVSRLVGSLLSVRQLSLKSKTFNLELSSVQDFAEMLYRFKSFSRLVPPCPAICAEDVELVVGHDGHTEIRPRIGHGATWAQLRPAVHLCVRRGEECDKHHIVHDADSHNSGDASASVNEIWQNSGTPCRSSKKNDREGNHLGLRRSSSAEGRCLSQVVLWHVSCCSLALVTNKTTRCPEPAHLGN